MSTGWHDLTWEEFVTALAAYKQRFAGKSGEDVAYFRCLRALQGRSMAERAASAGDIVAFLNSWAARVSRSEAPAMLGAWIREQADSLDDLSGLTIADHRLADRLDEIHALYGDLMKAGRARVGNWSDAANSKALHQLVPGVFVMWDNKIKRFALDYGDFTQHMHRLARRLVRESPYPPDRIETGLQAALAYSGRKPLTKYLDELNVVRAGQIGRPAPGPKVS